MLLNSLFKSSGNLSTLAYSFAKRDQRLWRTISQLIVTTNDRGPLWLIEVQFAEHLRFASVSCSPYLGLFSRLWPTFYPSSLTYYYVAITALSPSAATDPGRVCGTATEAVMVVCDMMCVSCEYAWCVDIKATLRVVRRMSHANSYNFSLVIPMLLTALLLKHISINICLI